MINESNHFFPRMRTKVLEDMITRSLSATGTAGVTHGSFYASEKIRVFQTAM